MSRCDDIQNEHEQRICEVGHGAADQELYRALERAEAAESDRAALAGRLRAVHEEENMKLFLIQFDGQPDYVEAETMKAAIDRWHEHRRANDPEWDTPDTPEPESCALVHEDAVIR